jgi:ribulose-5-phosphate 4-epimerase/fuculose-1-phosphate aldolase
MSIAKQLIEICHKVCEKGIVSAYVRNISCWVSDDGYLITWSEVCKGDIIEDDIVLAFYGLKDIK